MPVKTRLEACSSFTIVLSRRTIFCNRNAPMTNPEIQSRIRVVLPYHLRNLARVDGEVTMEVAAPVTIRKVLDALEVRYPMLSGTIRDHVTQQRRPFLRFFACEEDLSHHSTDAPLPEEVAKGREPLLIIGAIAGG